MTDKRIKILFVCVKKGVRASIAKSIINTQGKGKIKASAACFETGGIPSFLKEELPKFVNIPADDEVCKTVFDWRDTSESFDYVITLCDEGSAEQCSIFKKVVNTTCSYIPSHKHWSIPNLAKAQELQGKVRTDFVAKVIGQIAVEVDNFIEIEKIRIWDDEAMSSLSIEMI